MAVSETCHTEKYFLQEAEPCGWITESQRELKFCTRLVSISSLQV